MEITLKKEKTMKINLDEKVVKALLTNVKNPEKVCEVLLDMVKPEIVKFIKDIAMKEQWPNSD